MKYREFVRWCNERACDGHWGLYEAAACSSIIREVERLPFRKRERYWRENYEIGTVEVIVNPTEKKIRELEGSREIKTGKKCRSFPD